MDITTATNTIRSSRLRGEYREGNDYISALPPSLRHNALVVIESAYLLLVQGKFSHALEALESYCLPAATPQSEVVAGCLALMHGYAITQCRCKLLTAWEEAARVRKALLEPELGFIIDPEETAQTARGNGKQKGGIPNYSRLTVRPSLWSQAAPY